MSHAKVARLLFSLVLSAGVAAPAAAQAPTVGFVFPPGGQAGTQAAVTLSGGNLQGATAILVAGEGVRPEITRNSEASSLAATLHIDPDAVPGVRELRVVTPRGVSNPARIWIGPYPEANEAEPNNTPAAAQKLDRLPLTLNGQVNGAEDVDTFSFQAGAGETFVFDLTAARMASALDGYLTLYDARGKVLKSSLEGFDRDPRIVYTFKNAGTYSIQVRDTLYRGGGNFVYKLTVGRVPLVTGYYPRGGRPGETLQVRLEGVNLGETRSVQVSLPSDRETVTVLPRTAAGPAVAPITLFVTDLPEGVETEPNDRREQASALPAVPGIVDGRMESPGDVDLFRVRPAAAGTLRFEVIARRIGSRIDPVLRVLDASGKELQSNDDADGKDSRVTLQVQANTEYLVEVRALDQSSGDEAFYRLLVGPPLEPDFRLTATPPGVNVGPGGSAAIAVNLRRIGGFGGPVTLRVEGLPNGVTASPAVIPAGANSVRFTLTAASNAEPGGMALLRIVGTGEASGKTLERTAQPVEVYTPPLAQPNQTAERPAAMFPVGIGSPPAYTLDVEQRQITVKKGASVQIKVRATRQMGQNAQINLTVEGQPANVNPQAANIPANQTEAVITIAVAGNAPTTTANLIISGNMNNNVQVAPAVTLTITD